MIEVEHNQYKKLFTSIHALLSHEDKEWPCEIIDISFQGCLLCFKTTWEPQNIEAIYTLTMQSPACKPIIINLSISHAIDNEVSFKCEHIDSDHRLILQQFAGTTTGASKLLARELLELTHSG